jgi:hypothetical protein
MSGGLFRPDQRALRQRLTAPGVSPIAAEQGETQGGVVGLVPVISTRIAQCRTFAMAATSPAMTMRERHEFCPYCIVA